MGKRTLVELLHIVVGVVATGVIANLAAWSVPNAANAIWWVALFAAAVVIYMGIAPLRAAWDEDRRKAGSTAAADCNTEGGGVT